MCGRESAAGGTTRYSGDLSQGDTPTARMLMGIVSDMPAARAKLAKAMAFVNEVTASG
jgi:hypothetical protein